MAALAVRQEVLEFGSCPACPWLAQVETLQAIRAVLQELLQVSTFDEHGRSFVTPQAISTALDITSVQTRVLLDLLAAVAEPPELVQRSDVGEEVVAVDPYSLALFLFAHYYLREAHRADASDVWPSDNAGQLEPSSPMRMTAHSWAREQQGGHSQKSYLPVTRQHLQQHLQHQEALMAGWGGFVGRHADVLLGLVSAPAAPSPGKAPQPQGMVAAAELDRLAFLLRPPTAEEVEGFEGQAAPTNSSGSGGGSGAASGGRKRRLAEGGSPMDVCATPFTEDSVRLSEHTPFFGGDAPTAYAPLDAVVGWLADTLSPADDGSDLMVTSSGCGGGSPPAPTHQRHSVFNQLATQLGVLGPPAPSHCDISGVHRATVARGEDDFPAARARVVDCHDAVVYCLAPLQYALISACTDCVVVLGAVGRAVRIERCERVQVVAAGRCMAVNTCHDCILYLAPNQPPLLLGDNRFLQLAPYNSGYERLVAHMQVAGVRPTPNCWDQPLALLPDHSKQQQAQAQAGEPGSPMQQWQAAAAAREQQHRAAATGAQVQRRLGSLGGGEWEPMDLSHQQGQQQQQEGQQQQQQQQQQQGTDVGAGPSPGSPGCGGHLGEEGAASPVAGAPAAVTVLPPSKLTPFVVPFKGGPGPMCGGPAAISLGIRASPSGSADSLSSFMAVGEGPAGNFPPSPFPLPPAYATAWQQKMQGAAQVRAAVRASELDEARKRELMGAIQAHFKDWLQATGAMRQVYDLARAERDREDMAGTAAAGAGGAVGAAAAGGSPHAAQ